MVPDKYQVTIAAIRDVCARLKETGLLRDTDDNYACRFSPPDGAYNNLSCEDKKITALHVVKLKAATGSSMVRADLLNLYLDLLKDATLTKKALKPVKRKRDAPISADLDDDEDEPLAAPTPAAAPSADEESKA